MSKIALILLVVTAAMVLCSCEGNGVDPKVEAAKLAKAKAAAGSTDQAKGPSMKQAAKDSE